MRVIEVAFSPCYSSRIGVTQRGRGGNEEWFVIRKRAPLINPSGQGFLFFLSLLSDRCLAVVE